MGYFKFCLCFWDIRKRGRGEGGRRRGKEGIVRTDTAGQVVKEPEFPDR